MGFGGPFSIQGKIAVVIGATGGLGREMTKALVETGATVCAVSRTQAKADSLVAEIEVEGGAGAGFSADVMSLDSVKSLGRSIQDKFGRVDILVNSAGGNDPGATTGGDKKFWDLGEDGLRNVMNLNLLGTMFPCQIFGEIMAEQREGCIINVSSMAALTPITRVVGYSATKAGIDNFTRWLAVHMAKECAPAIRVNAIAPGFFETEQNRFLLRDEETGMLSERGQSITDHTPMGRFGEPGDLRGVLQWLVSPAACFVTGIVVPVDGGFSAFCGV